MRIAKVHDDPRFCQIYIHNSRDSPILDTFYRIKDGVFSYFYLDISAIEGIKGFATQRDVVEVTGGGRERCDLRLDVSGGGESLSGQALGERRVAVVRRRSETVVRGAPVSRIRPGQGPAVVHVASSDQAIHGDRHGGSPCPARSEPGAARHASAGADASANPNAGPTGAGPSARGRGPGQSGDLMRWAIRLAVLATWVFLDAAFRWIEAW